MNQKELLRGQLRRDGGPACLPDYPTGPVLPKFDPLALAQALEHEVNRSGILRHTKISIHMNIEDAAVLATALRSMARKR